MTKDGVGDAENAPPVLGLTVLVRLTVPLKPFAPVSVVMTVVEAPASRLVVEGLEDSLVSRSANRSIVNVMVLVSFSAPKLTEDQLVIFHSVFL